MWITYVYTHCNLVSGTLFIIHFFFLKFTFSEKATKVDKIFTVNLTVCSNTQIDRVKILWIFVAFLENINFNWNLRNVSNNWTNNDRFHDCKLFLMLKAKCLKMYKFDFVLVFLNHFSKLKQLQLNLHDIDLSFWYLSHHLTWHCSSISEGFNKFARNLHHLSAKLFLLLFPNNFRPETCKIVQKQ